MSRNLKIIIGAVLLLVGLWVLWSGYVQTETITMALGAASILGGVVFLATSGQRRPIDRT